MTRTGLLGRVSDRYFARHSSEPICTDSMIPVSSEVSRSYLKRSGGEISSYVFGTTVISWATSAESGPIGFQSDVFQRMVPEMWHAL